MRYTIKGPKVTWVDIFNPTKEDILYLKDNFNFHPLVLEELIPPGHWPRAERHENYIFMILYHPIYKKEQRETYSRELDIIATKDILVTSHYGSILPLKALFDNCNLYEESREIYMSETPGHLLYFILIGLWKNCLIKLGQIDIRINEIERRIFQGKEKEMVKEISLVKTDIIDFWRIIEPQKEILESIKKEVNMFWGRELDPYFEDVLGTYSQTWQSIKTYRETILALEDTNQSLLTTKTNEVIRILTVFSVTLLPLTFIAGIYGMNTTYLPFRGPATDFWIISGVMLAIVAAMILFFKKKGWL